MRLFHQYWGWAAVGAGAIVGTWGLVLAARRTRPGRPFWVGVAVATGTMLIQIGTGVYLVATRTGRPGDQHVFYGIVVAFVLAFAYIYRPQLARRPALSYGLLFLFLAGLALRAIATFGVDF
jgi:hypothetical protein